MTIYIINSGIGNFNSVKNMLGSIGLKSIIVEKVCEVIKPSGLILPGIGHFDSLMKKLKQSGWSSYISEAHEETNYPILGICAGMQVLCQGSEEGNEPGIGVIPGILKKFNFNESVNSLKVPHMGWAKVYFDQSEFHKLSEEQQVKFYFLHSYYYADIYKSYVLAKSNYGVDFASAIKSKNVYGVQFHPEKSHNFGKIFFRTFFKREFNT